MNLESIRKTISDYNDLRELAESVFKLMCEFDSKTYSTHRYVNEISFERETVYVTCDNSWGGCTDYSYYEFPLDWIVMDKEQLERIVVESRKIREEHSKLKREQELEAKRLEDAEREYQKYLKLKEKFEK
jgi:hypothetical protein